MSIKRAVLILCLVCFLAVCSCDSSSEEQDSIATEQLDLTGGYQALLDDYNSRDLAVNVTLTVDTFIPVESRFSLVKTESGYTVTDLDSGSVRLFDAKTPLQTVYKEAAYLPPCDTAYPTGEGSFGSRLSGDINLEMLLGASNFFDGYSSEQADLDGECIYTASADGQLRSYSYEFSVNINDADAQFPAKIKYYIEVNQ